MPTVQSEGRRVERRSGTGIGLVQKRVLSAIDRPSRHIVDRLRNSFRVSGTQAQTEATKSMYP